MTLLQGAVLTTGCRTVSRILRLVGSLADSHWSSYHRVLSHRRWSMWPLARALAEYIVSAFYHKGWIRIAGDETVTEHPGKKVYGKGRHRDAKRSTHSYTAHLWGHKWVVLAILVDLPGISRPWALPILVALNRNKKDNQALGRRHKTPTDLMRQLLCVLLRWFGDIPIVNFGSPSRDQTRLRSRLGLTRACGRIHSANVTPVRLRGSGAGHLRKYSSTSAS
jgi:hypothetical protein